ncbi:glycosyltransferase family 39 protein, partial [Alicyclobacillus fodiniaquatilis]
MDASENRKHKQWIWDILALNLLFRGVFILFVHPAQKADFLWYFNHAKMMAENQGYVWGGQPTAYWPIGWPFFLSLIFRLTGAHILVGMIVNVLLSTVIVWLVYALARNIFQSEPAALCAAIAYSLLPSQIEWNAVLGSEALFTALLLFSLYLYVKSEAQQSEKQAFGWILLAGISLGFAADVRPIPLFFPLFILLYEWLVWRRRWWTSLRRALALCAAMLLAIAPVTIRNGLALHRFVLISTNGGVNLWQGTHTNDGYFWSWNPQVNPLVKIADEVLKNKIAKEIALNRILDDIVLTIGNGFLKIYHLYKTDVNATWYTLRVIPAFKHWVDPVNHLNTTAYYLLMAFALIGLIQFIARSNDKARSAWLPLAFILYNTCFFFFFPAWDRFRYPL